MPDPTILHLTDLHLGDANPDSVLGAYKSRFVNPEQRTTRERLLGETLGELQQRLKENDEELASIVISGDITYIADRSGFEKLDELLTHLGDQRPPNDRVVIVPGNHDVTWKTQPDSKERYELFREFVVDQGYVVPALASNEKVDANNLLIDEENNFLIAPLNSSNWCGVMEPVDETLEKFLAEEKISPQIRSEIASLRLADPARIAEPHIGKLRKVLREVDSDQTLTRIAVLHHQLLPVTTDEELKAFEGLTNLQLMRRFLASNSFALVLHGHKHSELAYYDRIVEADRHFPDRADPVLVLSGSTLGGADSVRKDICRLIRLGGTPAAPAATIERIDAADIGSGLPVCQPIKYPLWSAPSPEAVRSSGPTAIYGNDLDETYARLMQVAEDIPPEEPLANLSCHIRGSGMEPHLPRLYPTDFLGDKDPEEWFSETVEWWQRSGVTRNHGDLVFSHGDRIRSYRAGVHRLEGVDQLEAVEEILLKEGPYNGRAVVSLLDPCIDRPSSRNHRYPAFTNAQFVKRRVKRGLFEIDATAYFRKQELRYWWPVNVAELCVLQTELVERLGAKYSPGTLSTVSTIAYVEEFPPPVAISRVDVLFEKDRDELFRLAFSLLGRADDSIGEEWGRVLEDLVPPPDQELPMAGPPVALNGLKALSEDIARLASASGRQDLEDISSALEEIHRENETYAAAHVNTAHQRSEYLTWQKKIASRIVSLKKMVERCLDADEVV
jgi:3',5'-cyclic AMP phosphodiesterase CpdA